MREFGWDKCWDCLRLYFLKRWGNSAQTSFETVWQYFRWSDEEIRLGRVLKLSDNVFVQAMRQFSWDKYWDCLRFFSLKLWGNSIETSSETVWQFFRWSDEEIRLRRVLKLSYSVFVEAMREFSWDKFENCLTIFPLKWWGNPFKTCCEIVLNCVPWGDEEIKLRQDWKLSDKDFVGMMKKSGQDVF